MSTTLRLFVYCAISCFTLSLSAQKFPYKFGKVSSKDFAESNHPADTSAVAVFLYKTGNTSYTYENNLFYTHSIYSARIKVLKEEGKRYADVVIPYYIFGQADIILRERVEKLRASSYNMANGKVEKTDLDKSYAFDEKVSENLHLLKFSIPNVQVGSIIEYEYTVVSNYPFYLRDLEIQEEVPVNLIKYDVLIPKYFRFRTGGNGKGIEHQNTLEGQTFYIQVESLQANGQRGTQMADVQTESFRHQYNGKNLPALKEEPFIWCKDDYRTTIHFEFQKTDFPYAIPYEQANTWGSIMGALKGHDSFGRFLRMKNPLKEETNRWLSGNSSLTTIEKARELFKLLKSQMQWNGSYRLFGTNPTKSLTESKSGSNADINFIYMSMLRDAGIPCAPVLIRNRKEGQLPLYFASVNKLSTFVVAFFDEEKGMHCVDASIEQGDIDILPLSIMPETGVLLDYNGDPPSLRYVNLSQLGKHYTTHQLSIHLSNEGIATGKCISSYRGQDALARRKAFQEATDSLDILEKLPNPNEIKVAGYTSENMRDISNGCEEQFQFTYQPLSNGEHLYINPFMFLEEQDNPFKSPTRQLPIELPCKERLMIISTCKIPDNYTVEELPKSLILRLPDNSLHLTYSVTQAGNEITVNYKFNITKTYFEAERYEELKNFMAGLIEANQFQIVLKRKS